MVVPLEMMISRVNANITYQLVTTIDYFSLYSLSIHSLFPSRKPPGLFWRMEWWRRMMTHPHHITALSAPTRSVIPESFTPSWMKNSKISICAQIKKEDEARQRYFIRHRTSDMVVWNYLRFSASQEISSHSTPVPLGSILYMNIV